MIACSGLTLLSLQRMDLLHATFFNVCTMRSYDLHWQNRQRLPQALRYDFTLSPDSFVLLEMWITDGPTLSFSQRVPLSCPITYNYQRVKRTIVARSSIGHHQVR